MEGHDGTSFQAPSSGSAQAYPVDSAPAQNMQPMLEMSEGFGGYNHAPVPPYSGWDPGAPAEALEYETSDEAHVPHVSAELEQPGE